MLFQAYFLFMIEVCDDLTFLIMTDFKHSFHVYNFQEGVKSEMQEQARQERKKLRDLRDQQKETRFDQEVGFLFWGSHVMQKYVLTLHCLFLHLSIPPSVHPSVHLQ